MKLLLLGFILLISTSVYSQNGQGGGNGPGWVPPSVAPKLDLSCRFVVQNQENQNNPRDTYQNIDYRITTKMNQSEPSDVIDLDYYKVIINILGHWEFRDQYYMEIEILKGEQEVYSYTTMININGRKEFDFFHNAYIPNSVSMHLACKEKF